MRSYEPIPDFLAALCTKRSQHIAATHDPVAELDTEHAQARVIDYLKKHAPKAKAFEGGNDTTYKVASRVREFGVSEGVAFELMSIHWNED